MPDKKYNQTTVTEMYKCGRLDGIIRNGIFCLDEK